MRPSLKHDAFADLMRKGWLDFDTYFRASTRTSRRRAWRMAAPNSRPGSSFTRYNDLSGGRWARFCSDGEGGSRPLCFAP